MLRLLLVVLALASACVPGGADVPRRLAGGGGDASLATITDGGENLPEAGSAIDGSAADATPGADARVPVDGGVAGDAAAPADAGVGLDAAPTSCETGFLLENQRCVPDAPEPFRSRTEAEVCARWRADRTTVPDEWTSTGTDACDRGVFSQAGQDSAIMRTNLYRWLCGLDPVTEATSRLDTQQACAVLQRAMGRLDHRPGAEEPCYTPEGAQGAGSSNLAFGTRTAAQSVDLYVDDSGIASLGHRRWVLNPYMGQTAFGFVPPASCMYSFDFSGSGASAGMVSWPPPGFAPVDGANGRWSFESSMARVQQGTTVEVAVGDGPYQPVQAQVLGAGGSWETVIAWSPERGHWDPGQTIRVAIRGTSAGDVLYTVRTVTCP